MMCKRQWLDIFLAQPLAFSWMSVSVVGIFCKCTSLLPEREGVGGRGGGFGGCRQSSRRWEDARTNTLPQSEISRKGLGIDLVDSWAAITYESNSQEIRTVCCLMATLPPTPSPWQCQPMSHDCIVPLFKLTTLKLAKGLCFSFFFFVLIVAFGICISFFTWHSRLDSGVTSDANYDSLPFRSNRAIGAIVCLCVCLFCP